MDPARWLLHHQSPYLLRRKTIGGTKTEIGDAGKMIATTIAAHIAGGTMIGTGTRGEEVVAARLLGTSSATMTIEFAVEPHVPDPVHHFETEIRRGGVPVHPRTVERQGETGPRAESAIETGVPSGERGAERS